MNCHHNNQICIKLIQNRVSASEGSSGTKSKVLKVRNPPEQAASVILVQDTQGIFGTHGPSVTHICINASEDTNSSPSVEGGPYPWYGHLVRNRNKTAPTH